MKMSTKSRYGLRLMLDLAANGRGHEKISLHQVAQRQDISEKYLWQIANGLKTAGLISAVSGAGGGYVLNKSPQEISVADILEALEGEINLAPCVKLSAICSRKAECISREVWRELNAKLTEVMRAMTLSDALKKHTDSLANVPLTYSI